MMRFFKKHRTLITRIIIVVLVISMIIPVFVSSFMYM